MSGKRNLSADGCTIKTLLLCIRRAVAGLVRRSQQVNLRQSSRYTVIIFAAVAQYSLSTFTRVALALESRRFYFFLLTLLSSQAVQAITSDSHQFTLWFLFLRGGDVISYYAYAMNKLESHAFTPTQIYSIYDNSFHWARKSVQFLVYANFIHTAKQGKKANIDSQCINVQRLNGWFK